MAEHNSTFVHDCQCCILSGLLELRDLSVFVVVVVANAIVIGVERRLHELGSCSYLPALAIALVAPEDVVEGDKLALVGEGDLADRHRSLVEKLNVQALC